MNRTATRPGRAVMPCEPLLYLTRTNFCREWHPGGFGVPSYDVALTSPTYTSLWESTQIPCGDVKLFAAQASPYSSLPPKVEITLPLMSRTVMRASQSVSHSLPVRE